jgi:hypothetical protein
MQFECGGTPDFGFASAHAQARPLANPSIEARTRIAAVDAPKPEPSIQ